MSQTATNWWLRSPNTNNTNNVYNVNSDGSSNNNNYNNSNGVRPALMEMDSESSITAKTVPPSSKGDISCSSPLCKRRRQIHCVDDPRPTGWKNSGLPRR